MSKKTVGLAQDIHRMKQPFILKGLQGVSIVRIAKAAAIVQDAVSVKLVKTVMAASRQTIVDSV